MATSRKRLSETAADVQGEVIERAQEAANTGIMDKMAMARKAMADINKAFARKPGQPYAIHTADKLPPVERIQSGWVTFDVITGGGFPRRRATQVKGPNHVGKTTVLLDAFALQQQYEEVGIWVQGEEYDQGWARQRGVDNTRMVIVPTSDATTMLETTVELMSAGFASMVAIDSIQAIKPKRALDTPIGETGFGSGGPQLWGDFQGKVLNLYSQGLTDAALVWVSQMRAVISTGWTAKGAPTDDGTLINTLLHWKSVDVRFSPRAFLKASKEDKEPYGRIIALKNEKNKVGPTPYMQGEISHIYYQDEDQPLPIGTDRGGEIAAWSQYFSLVEKRGTRFYLPNDERYGKLANTQVAMGLDSFLTWCRSDNPDFVDAQGVLVERIYEEAMRSPE